MSDFTPRPYQQEAKDIVDHLPDGSRVIVHMATGLGKTATMSLFDRKGRMLILSHRDELVRQPEKYFQDATFGIEKADEHANGEDIVSASVQTLSKDKRLESYKKDDFDIIIVDEAHHAAAPSYRKILDYFKPRLLIGLTATPKRGDRVKLNDVFDEIVFSRDLMWGIKNGYLSNVKSLAIETDISLDKVSMTAGDYNQKELADAIDKDEIYDAIIKTYKKYIIGTDHHVIIYCLNVKTCEVIQERLSKAFPEEKDRMAIITGSTSAEDRSACQDAYMNGNIRCLINCMVLTEGVDLPVTDTIIIARPTANETLYTQIIGRGTRLYEGKDHCLILDILPKSTHKVCSVATLAGIDFQSLNSEERKKMTEKELDLSELIRKKEEEEKRQKQLEEALTLRIKEYDIVKGIIIEQTEKLVKQGNQGLSYLADTITEDRIEFRKNAEEEDGISNTYHLHYHLGRTEDTRYQFKGADKNYLFTISKPDMLGKSTAEGYINGIYYKTTKPRSIDELLHTISNIYDKYCTQTYYYWNQEIIDSWKESDATEKQVCFIRNLLRRKRIPFKADKNLSKYEASIMIDHILQLDSLESEVNQAQRNLQKQHFDSLPQRISQKVYHPFEDLIKQYLYKEMPDNIKTMVNKKHFLRVRSMNPFSGQENTAPTQNQLDTVEVLTEKAKQRSVSFDISIEDFVKGNTTANEISHLIDILKDIRRIPDCQQYGYSIIMQLDPVMDKICGGNTQKSEEYKIPYTYQKL